MFLCSSYAMYFVRVLNQPPSSTETNKHINRLIQMKLWKLNDFFLTCTNNWNYCLQTRIEGNPVMNRVSIRWKKGIRRLDPQWGWSLVRPLKPEGTLRCDWSKESIFTPVRLNLFYIFFSNWFRVQLPYGKGDTRGNHVFKAHSQITLWAHSHITLWAHSQITLRQPSCHVHRGVGQYVCFDKGHTDREG